MSKIICISLIFFVSCVPIREYKNLEYDTESAKAHSQHYGWQIDKMKREIKQLQKRQKALEQAKRRKIDTLRNAINRK